MEQIRSVADHLGRIPSPPKQFWKQDISFAKTENIPDLERITVLPVF